MFYRFAALNSCNYASSAHSMVAYVSMRTRRAVMQVYEKTAGNSSKFSNGVCVGNPIASIRGDKAF